ncbi:MAG: EamA family transporter [Candidatus Micrarchaeota archaeon]|nr:EamA family transporter [Candidatus Micrarchaeota archaeon]
METYVVYAFVSMFLFGIYLLFLKQTKGIDSVTLTLVSLTTSTAIILFYWFLTVQNKNIISNLDNLNMPILAGVVYAVSILLMISALQIGKASVVSPITALSSVVVVLFSFFFLGESLSNIKIVGVILAVLAAILLST